MTLLALLLFVRIAPEPGAPPLRQPQMAKQGNAVLLTYGAADKIYFARSDDGGRTFNQPVTVASGRKILLGNHRGPRVATVPGSIVISAIDGDLLTWRSTDGGKTWSTAGTINDAPASAREGLHAMASDGKGRLFAVWLDLRQKGTRLYGAVSTDGGASWSPNTLVYESPSGSICECCHPTARMTGAGEIYVMFRNSVGGARDLYLVKSLDAGKSFGPAQKLGEGTWLLEACPMDGGDLSLDDSGRPTTVWRRMSHVFLTRSGESEKEIGSGKNPALASGIVAWSDGMSVKALLPGDSEPLTLADHGGFVQLLSTGGASALAAWESDGAIEITSLPPAK